MKGEFSLPAAAFGERDDEPFTDSLQQKEATVTPGPVRELEGMLKSITGLSFSAVVDHVVSGESDEKMIRRVSDHVRRETRDTLREAVEEMWRDKP